MIETLLNDLRAGRDLTAVLQDLAENHRDLLAKWNGACLEAILPDLEFAVKRLSEKIPHHASMFEDVHLLMRDAIPSIAARDSAKRYRRTAEMMYWAMYGYGRYMDTNADKTGQRIPVDEGEAMATLTAGLDALTSALRMVRFATLGDKPEVCARLARDACPQFVQLIARARDHATHVAAVAFGGCYTGAFGDDGKVLPMGSAAKALIEEIRERLIGMLVEAYRATAEDVTP